LKVFYDNDLEGWSYADSRYFEK